jgi:hypothetical protein
LFRFPPPHLHLQLAPLLPDISFQRILAAAALNDFLTLMLGTPYAFLTIFPMPSSPTSLVKRAARALFVPGILV